eukprot:GEMP01014505.1.p1 GENE.GEMP01014505.1~~GEMP01014505.1.p1  ORF type:complete len:637 (+),score=139.26 GEMP01014505.1:563-2473(+)
MRDRTIAVLLVSAALILLMFTNLWCVDETPDVIRLTEMMVKTRRINVTSPGPDGAAALGNDAGPGADAARGHDTGAKDDSRGSKKNTGEALENSETRSEKNTTDFGSPDEDHLHGALGVDGGSRLWNPTPLKKALQEWTAEESRKAHEEYCFNTVVSDSLPLDRERYDSRRGLCKEKEYAVRSMKPASIIIVFFNEAFSPLVRSVHSILNYEPPGLIGEIVLVDDGSILAKRPWLGSQLDYYIRKGLPKTRLSRLPARSGLMRARMHGAQIATFENLIFLDSHIECSPRWIEPLLARLTADYRNVALPVIESIDPHDFTKSRGGIGVLGHSWRLGQMGIPGRNESESEPNDSPIMAGGLFAITKRWFDDLGQYDPELQEYGGEEMEISFKIWQCGGKMQSIPCSRIGHVFRTGKYWQGLVFSVGPHVITRNKLRAAAVWMDDAATIVELAFPVLPADQSIGDLSVPRKVRDRLQCHDFNWYLSTVYPELWKPSLQGSHHGSIQHMITTSNPACLDTLMGNKGDAIGAYPCHYQHGSQAFLLTGNGKLRVAMMDFTTCLSVKIAGLRGAAAVMLSDCADSDAPWTFDIVDAKVGTLRQGDMCMGAMIAETPKSPFSLTLTKCTDLAAEDPSVHWEWV